MKLMDFTRYASGKALRLWIAAQVELHGKYSVERTRKFHQFSARVRWPRVLWWSVVTPIPCLLFNTVMDFAPLAKPSEGRDANYVFWLRCFTVVFLLIYGIYQQIRFLAPGLDFTNCQIVFSSFLVSSMCIPYNYTVAGYVGMPIPFMLLTGTPVFLIGTAGVLLLLFGRNLRADRATRVLLFRALAIVNIQLGLTVLYPIFMYGFNSLPPIYQNPYTVLLPLIKLAAKNAMSKIVDDDDMKPEVVIFNIEIFNALYVSLAMGRASSWSTSLILFGMDVIQAWISVHDLQSQARNLQELLVKIPVCYRQDGASYLDVAIALLNDAIAGSPRGEGKIYREKCPSKVIDHEQRESLNRVNKVCRPRANKVCIIPPQSIGPARSDVKVIPQCNSAVVSPLPTCISSQVILDSSLQQNRENFLQVFTSILFTVEFIILVEYTEVIIPAFYGIYMTAIFYLPNREFYPSLAHIDEDQLQLMIANVFLYAALELLSFVGIAIVVRRLVGISAVKQLGFVLQTQWGMVQSKLLAWIFYAVQNSLEHMGEPSQRCGESCSSTNRFLVAVARRRRLQLPLCVAALEVFQILKPIFAWPLQHDDVRRHVRRQLLHHTLRLAQIPS